MTAILEDAENRLIHAIRNILHDIYEQFQQVDKTVPSVSLARDVAGNR